MPFELWSPGNGVVELPTGVRIRGRGLGLGGPIGQLPEFGVYLLDEPPKAPNWPSIWIPWPDFELPIHPEATVASLVQAVAHAATKRVEIACLGGRGRTGTALAVAAIVAGITPIDATEWVRSNYRLDAVETAAQEAWIASITI